MKAKFYVKTIESDWKPPFRKEIKEETYVVGTNNSFDRIVGNNNNESVFTFLGTEEGKAEIRFSKLFTVKGYENPTDNTLRMDKGEEKTLAYLWGEKGISKKIVFKGMAAENEL
jgi:hypothetical protein